MQYECVILVVFEGYGDDLSYRYSRVISHDEQQWQLLDDLVEQAVKYWEMIPSEKQDFDRAKWVFMIKDTFMPRN